MNLSLDSPFQAAFEGLQQELGSRASAFASSSPPLVSSPLTPQSRHTQAFYPNASSSPAPASGPGHRSKTKICGVCGDRAKSYHFGGISCDSCKGTCPSLTTNLAGSCVTGQLFSCLCLPAHAPHAPRAAFFRRSVQNDAYKNFHCPYEGQCDINITSRKCCQYCR